MKHLSLALLAVGFVLLVMPAAFATTINHYGGTYSLWPTTWTALDSLNDPLDGVAGKLDFVGDSSDAGGYWATNDDYVFFRARMAVGTVSASTYTDTLFVLLDQPGQGTAGYPDYGFAWDTKGLRNSGEELQHGLEFTILNLPGASWGATRMGDIDGNAAKKISPPDINRAGNGYVRTIDGQATANFGTTTFVDWAVSWDYLAGQSTLAPGQNWRVQFGSIANATDHNNITTDVAGGTNPSTPGLDWSDPIPASEVPEPGTLALFGLGLAGLIASRRLRRR